MLSLNVQLALNNNNLTQTTKVNENNQTITMEGIVKDNGLKYYTTLKVIVKDGESIYHQDRIDIVNASEVLLLLACESDYENNFPIYRDEDID